MTKISLHETSLSKTSLHETSLLKTSLHETSLYETSLLETRLFKISLFQIMPFGVQQMIADHTHIITALLLEQLTDIDLTNYRKDFDKVNCALPILADRYIDRHKTNQQINKIKFNNVDHKNFFYDLFEPAYSAEELRYRVIENEVFGMVLDCGMYCVERINQYHLLPHLIISYPNYFYELIGLCDVSIKFTNPLLVWLSDNAAQSNHIIDHLLDRLDINDQDPEGKTSLNHIIGKNKPHLLPLIKRLIDRADLNKPDNLGITPLIRAVLVRDVEVVKLLLSAKCQTTLQTKRGNTAINVACDTKQHQIVRLLLEADKSILNTPNNSMMNPLLFAASRDTFDTAILLIRAQCDINVRSLSGVTALGYAIKNKNDHLIIELVGRGCSLDRAWLEENALFVALFERCDVEVLNHIIDKLSDHHLGDLLDDGNNMLQQAIDSRADASIINRLIAMKCSITHRNNKGENAIDILCSASWYWYGYEETVKNDILSRMMAEKELYGCPDLVNILSRALFISIGRNHSEVVQQLIAWGADLNSTDSDGRNICDMLEFYDYKIAKVLLSKGYRLGKIDLLIKWVGDYDGSRTPTFCNEKNDNGIYNILHSTIFGVLDYDDIDLNEGDEEGNTILHYAVRSDSCLLARYFYSKGAREKENNEGIKPSSLIRWGRWCSHKLTDPIIEDK